VTFSNFATSGATVPIVATEQLPEAVSAGPIDLASLIVGVNDTLRSTFDASRIRDHLDLIADQLTSRGALLLTVRFHDHGQVFGLPKWLRRPLWRRIEQVNLVYDDLHAKYGGIRLDMADYPEVYRRDFWSIDRLHPGERGHRRLARSFADELTVRGVRIDVPPELDCAYRPPSKWADALWLVREGVPWVGRRANDLLPWAARMAFSRPGRLALPPSSNAEVQRLEA
jgi:lysophospholipase L1-like esterase